MPDIKKALATYNEADELLNKKIDNNKTDTDIKIDNTNSILHDVKYNLNMFTTTTIAKITTSGWYRFFMYNSNTESLALGGGGYNITIALTRDYWSNNNETHKIDLIGIYNNIKFINENSISNSLVISKIRVVKARSNTYIDIYYNANSTNRIIGSIINAQSPTGNYWRTIATPYKVDETVSGETVLSNYILSKNRTVESRLATTVINAESAYVGVGWHKAAECSFSDAYTGSRRATFLVSSLKNSGILTVMIQSKTGSTLALDNVYATWESRTNGIDVNSFVVIGKLENDRLIGELWVNLKAQYTAYIFTTLDSTTRIANIYTNNAIWESGWKSCSSSTASTSYPTDYDKLTVSSDYSTAKYDSDGNDIAAKLAALEKRIAALE